VPDQDDRPVRCGHVDDLLQRGSQRFQGVLALVQLAGAAVSGLVVEDHPVVTAPGQRGALEVEGTHVQAEAVDEDDCRVAFVGEPEVQIDPVRALDDLDVDVQPVVAGDGEAFVVRQRPERLVQVGIDPHGWTAPPEQESFGCHSYCYPGGRDPNHRTENSRTSGDPTWTVRLSHRNTPWGLVPHSSG
jgi:hypothetical protein